MKTRLMAVASLLALIAAGPSLAMTWQEANKQSAAALDAGKLEEAEELARKAAELYTASPTYKPANHAQLLLNYLGMVEESGDAKKRLVAARYVLRALEARAGEGVVETIQFQEEILRAQYRVGEFADAQLTHDKVVNLNAKHFGTDSLQYISALLQAADDVKQVKGAVDGRRYLDRASEVVAALAPDHPARLLVDLQHAKLDVEGRRYSTAEPKLTRIRDLLLARKAGEAAGLLRRTYGLLAFIHDMRGDDAALDAVINATRDLPYPPGRPVPLAGRAPEVPRSNSSQLRGHAVVSFDISGDGRTANVKVVESSGNPQFAALAANAVERWRYQPRYQDGRPVATTGMVESFSYSIENDEPELGTRIKK
ncbi:energy transducer TonB [Aerophototrophica crusticola]|uniref:Energy transducer TonB n=1 Tax=Aerophototrophica crusticola TaxID=1709002 RepID=A0A858R653_9PROT|nr:energy transducer TonB [Rhodospirillaceae bacterium B3]